jgi:prophage regulatory protein
MNTLVTRNSTPGVRRCIRRHELRRIVPLSDTTIYELEQRGAFPRRFNLTPRCVAWDLVEVEIWIAQRRQQSHGGVGDRTPYPDVRMRKTRPMRTAKPDSATVT